MNPLVEVRGDNLQLVVEEGGELEGFELPFPVATLANVNQRAYISDDGKAEWLFSRVHSFCGISMEPGRMLRLNLDTIVKELEALQVPKEEFHYRGMSIEEIHQRKWKEHTLESRSLLVVLVWLMKNKALKAQVKVRSLNLLLDLVAKAFMEADIQVPLMGMVCNMEGAILHKELFFTPQGLCVAWGSLLNACSGAGALWKKLTTRCWPNRCISSAPDSASLADMWFFLCYLACHPKLKSLGQNIWLVLGKLVLPNLVEATGNWLEKVAIKASQETLQMLPTLRRKTGNARRQADPVNRVLLLWRLRKEKLHRQQVASTHGDLGASTSRMLKFENYLDCLLHMKALQVAFAGSLQISVAWDPSTYGGKDIFMGILYSYKHDAAAYLMCQQLGHTMMSELDHSLIEFAKNRQLTRLDGYKELKGLSCALESSIGVTLMNFKVPTGLICRPLTREEFRVLDDNGRPWILREGAEPVPQVPDNIHLANIPCLISISDQGPTNLAGMIFLMYSKQALMFLAIFDPFHRAWNDLKNAMKRTSWGCWRVVLEMTLVANLNYGPFGTSGWHWKKKARLEEFMATHDCNSEVWQKYQHLVCQERRIAEPASYHESQDLFQSLHVLDSFSTKGPLIKLMRWFSFFESMVFYEGELYCTKLVLESGKDGGGSEAEVQDEEALPQNKDDRKELQELKRRKGTWNLAPQLITPRALCIKDIIMSVGKATWHCFSERAREVKTTNQVLELNISCSNNMYWTTELLGDDPCFSL